MTAYYNEIEPYAAQWLRNLVAAGLIPAGDVDTRSIADVSTGDVAGYTQCHFFAGIAGWAYALRLAGWPDDRAVWTGSCPCQPFSVAGKQGGFEDSRHLWPEFRRLIAERSPSTVFGEQVAGATDWLRIVRGDLETLGYAVGAIPLEAASADADHFRDRYWFVANSDNTQWRPEKSARHHDGGPSAGRVQSDGDTTECGDRPISNGAVPDERWRGLQGSDQSRKEIGQRASDQSVRFNDRPLVNDQSLEWGEGWTEHEFRSRGFTAAVANIEDRQYLECPDGKWRRLPPPRVRWLGNGISARVAKLRAFGNAIDPRPAAQFISAYMEIAA